MKKKMYKAKKQWIIGLAAASFVTFVGVNQVKADANNGQAVTQQVTVQSASHKQVVNAGTTAQVNLPIRNVNYNDQVNNVPKTAPYNWDEETLGKYESSNSESSLRQYGDPQLIASRSNNDWAIQYQLKQPVRRSFTDLPNNVDAKQADYEWNGASFALHYQNTDDNNYRQINKISEFLSYSDKIKLYAGNNPDSTSPLYDVNGNYIVTIKGGQENAKMKEEALKNAPHIVVDKRVNGHHLTSLLQTQIVDADSGSSHPTPEGTTYYYNYYDGWMAYTYLDGQLVTMNKVVNNVSALREYVSEALAAKDGQIIDFGDAYSHGFPTDWGASNGDNIDATSTQSSICTLFADDGIYVIGLRATLGHESHAVAVKVPWALVNSQYKDFYAQHNTVPYTPTSTNPDHQHHQDHGTTPVTGNQNLGNLDSYQLTSNQSGQAVLHVTGWHAADASQTQPNGFLIVFDNTTHREVARQNINMGSRSDVKKAFPNVYNSINSGFSQDIIIPNSSISHQLSLVARYSDSNNGEGQHTDFWFNGLHFDTSNPGWLDAVKVNNGKVEFSGWHATNLALGRAYHTIIALDAQTNREIARTTTKKVSRGDVARAYPMIANAGQSGFDVSFDLNPAFVNDNIRIVSRWSASEDANSDYVDYWFNPTKLSIDRGNHAYMDSITSKQNKVTVSGWNATNESFGRKYHYIIAFDKTTNREISRQLVKAGVRSDVAKAFPSVMNAGQSGFTASFDLTPAMANDQIAYISRWSADPAGNNDYTDYWFNPVQKINRGYLDKAVYDAKQNTLNVAGWHANDASIYEPYRTLILYDATANKEVTRQTAKQKARSDVARAFGDIRTAGNAGFENAFTSFKPVAGHYYKLVSRYSLTADANENYTDYWFDVGKLR